MGDRAELGQYLAMQENERLKARIAELEQLNESLRSLLYASYVKRGFSQNVADKAAFGRVPTSL